MTSRSLRPVSLVVLAGLAIAASSGGWVDAGAAGSSSAADGECTIRGTPGDDHLRGSDEADVICGGRGDDKIVAGGGPDWLVGGRGTDRLNGGAGADTCKPSPGRDRRRGCVVEDGVARVVSYDVSPAEIDTSTGDREITFTVTVVSREALLGVIAFPRLATGAAVPERFRPIVQTRRVDGDGHHGTWRGTTTVSHGAPHGRWLLPVTVIPEHDPAQSIQLLDAAPPPGSGHPTFIQSGAGDTGPPSLLDLELSPLSIDTTEASQQVEVVAEVRDDVIGPELVQVQFERPDGSRELVTLTRSGDDGIQETWVGSLELRRFSPTGMYAVSEVRLMDEFWNGDTVTTAELEAMNLALEFEQTGVEDLLPPQLNSFSFSPHEADWSQDGSISVSLDASDELAGVRRVDVVFNSLGAQTSFAVFMHRRSGTATEGQWGGYVLYSERFPHASPNPGEYAVSVTLEDEGGNTAELGPQELGAAGYPTTFRMLP